jgi:hypothetical protein
MNKLRIFSLGISFLFVGPGLADPVDIPNQFQAGTPAVADEVNQNFSAAEVAIDDNAADITANTTAIADLQASVATLSSGAVKVKANGQSIGTFLASDSPNLFYFGSFWVLSDNEYVFLVRAESGMLFAEVVEGELAGSALMNQFVWYDGVGCTGQSYVDFFNIPPANEGVPLFRQGYVFASPDSADPVRAYYSPAGSATVSGLVMASHRFPGGIGDTCTDGMSAPPGTSFIQVLPNDSAITGVPNGPFAAPITLGR